MKEERPEMFAPYDLSVSEYGEYIHDINEQNIAYLRRLFEGAPLAPTQCLIVIGSDGKLERHAQSKTDVVLVQRKNAANNNVDDITAWFEGINPGETFKSQFDSQLSDSLEVVTLDDDSIRASYVYPELFTQPRSIYPDRGLNSIHIAGNTEVHLDLRKQVLLEMTAKGKSFRSIREEMKKQLRHYERAAKTGAYREVRVFGIELGGGENRCFQYYNEDPNSYTVGFKVPFLRRMQRFLDIATVVAIKEEMLGVDDAAKNLPTSTIQRLEYFKNIGLLQDQGAVEDVEDSYLWFLQRYHHVQELYKQLRIPIALSFDLDRYRMFRDTIGEFTKHAGYDRKTNFLTKRSVLS